MNLDQWFTNHVVEEVLRSCTSVKVRPLKHYRIISKVC